MTSVMVTGATTPIGEEVIRRLLHREDVEHVLAIGQERFGMPPPVKQSARLTYRAADLTRARSVHDLLFGPARELGVEVVVHTALHRSARLEGESVHALNVDATSRLVQLSEDHPTIRAFVFESTALVYRVRAEEATILTESHPLIPAAHVPEWLRDRLEADLSVCTRMGLSSLPITVLRSAECLAPAMGSQLWDYLSSRICLHPLGFDPMLNVISLTDLGRAIVRAADRRAQGIFNIPGRDTLALSELIYRTGAKALGVPDPFLDLLYAIRRAAQDLAEFRYDLNRARFHLGAVVDGQKARGVLGFSPETPIDWALISEELHRPAKRLRKRKELTHHLRTRNAER